MTGLLGKISVRLLDKEMTEPQSDSNKDFHLEKWELCRNVIDSSHVLMTNISSSAGHINL